MVPHSSAPPGLDGEPPASVEDIARQLKVEPDYASQAEAEALQRCRTKSAQEEFRKELRRIALTQLAAGGQKPAEGERAAET